jgi:SOS-response transcriptional repressor LexA
MLCSVREGGAVMIETKIAPAVGLQRRDEVLAFLIEWIARWGTSPSFADISRDLKMSSTRAKQLVKQLVERGVVEQIPGATRSLRVRDVAGSRNALEHALRNLGWTAAEPMGALLPPFPDGQLPIAPPFEHLPDPE